MIQYLKYNKRKNQKTFKKVTKKIKFILNLLNNKTKNKLISLKI